MTIYHDGEEHEQVELQTIPTADEMHALMVEKGFQMKPEEEVTEIKKKAEEQMEQELEARRQREERARQRVEERRKAKEEGGGVDDQKEKMREQARNLLKDMKLQDVVKTSGIDIDALPEEDQITPEQMKELKRRQWQAAKDKRRAAGIGEEL